MKAYTINIDIAECTSVDANSKEEAIEIARKQLTEAGCIWTVDDADLTAEEWK